jgi:hypothetical protein
MSGFEHLSAADRAAIDALMEAGLDPSRVAPEHRERAEKLGRLLGYLESDAAGAGLTDRTMDRIASASGEARTVVPADQRAIEHLLECGWDAGAVPEEHRTRARQAMRIFDELRVEDVSAVESADLADRTMDLIRVHEQRERAWSATAASELGERRRGLRLADLGSIAAIVLIGVAIFWPVLGGLKASAERRICEQNMHNAGVGFGLHASDQAGRLPMHQASLLRVAPGLASWWDVGTPQRSHSANLFQLVGGGYATIEDLACPGNHRAPVSLWGEAEDWRSPEEVSYSYQLFGGRSEPRLHELDRAVLLTDKSPVVVRARRGERVYAEERSHNHGGAGQHVLFSDGSASWLTRPVTPSGDNLWLPRELSAIDGVRLRGVELPRSLDDAFVGP